MTPHTGNAEAVTSGTAARRPVWAHPRMWANLAIGVPAVLPLSCAWWLLTEYLPMDCRSVADSYAPGFSGDCDYGTLDHAGPVMILLFLTGALLLTAVLVVDVLLPHSRGRSARPWLAATVFVPVPYAALAVGLHFLS
ncbi:hypothetical protein [Actinacidiphila sp. bgisy167]|uniref:hypothetical protein n=1 Tax=Actinacidiphila sp. bgisy167 TaxID=3413797 RepID=UPI003D74728E